jgi:hypothetical protein
VIIDLVDATRFGGNGSYFVVRVGKVLDPGGMFFEKYKSDLDDGYLSLRQVLERVMAYSCAFDQECFEGA